MPEGRESPPPETQSGRQLKDAPSSAKGVEKEPQKGKSGEEQLKNLASNPKGPMEDNLEAKYGKH